MYSDTTLKHFSDLPDFALAEAQPDARGWNVKTADNQDCGTVHDLIIDTAAMQVRYLEVTLDVKTLRSSEGRHVLIPLHDARFDKHDEAVVLSELTEVGVAALPPFQAGVPIDTKPATAPRANDAKRPGGSRVGSDDVERRPTLSEEEPISGDGTHKHARWGGPKP